MTDPITHFLLFDVKRLKFFDVLSLCDAVMGLMEKITGLQLNFGEFEMDFVVSSETLQRVDMSDQRFRGSVFELCNISMDDVYLVFKYFLFRTVSLMILWAEFQVEVSLPPRWSIGQHTVTSCSMLVVVTSRGGQIRTRIRFCYSDC